MTRCAASLAALLASAAGAQAPGAPAVIRVVGHGIARTAPDQATISFAVRGEGVTAEAATRALVARRQAIEAVFAGRAELRTGKLSVAAARDKDCDPDDDDKPRLSSGPCAVRGYLATLRFTARTAAVADAGTMLGEAARRGAVDPSLDEFALADPKPAHDAAVAAAVADARAQASAIAAASHVALGSLRRVEDQRAQPVERSADVVVTAAVPPGDADEPIRIALAPERIETTADLIVEFEVGGPAR